MRLDGAGIAILVSVLLWAVRLRFSASGAWSHIRWILLFGLWIERSPILDLVVPVLPSHNAPFRSIGWVALFLLVLSLAIILFKSLGPHGDEKDGEASSHNGSPTKGFLKPLIFPSRTTHARFFPKKHSFSYSYLLVGFPIGWRGNAGSLLSADDGGLGKRGWLRVDAADYLYRGDDPRGLKGKLDSYLETQNERLSDYPHVYLITAPRFLGYSFNPVSFWYLYNEAMELRAMISEVNNTFDERRIYFLKGAASEPQSMVPKAPAPVDAAASVAKDGAVIEPKIASLEVSKRFSSTWAKDFHVSPFNSRKGAYALSAQDPLRKGTVDNTITLSSSKGHPKLVARIFSAEACVDPAQTGPLSTLRFITAWWWVGFMTFPRIVKEATKLFFRRKLHVWYRPEVLKESLGRQATEDERAIEQCFHAFLSSTVAKSSSYKPVKYTSPIAGMPQVLYSRCPTKSQSPEPLDFKVTSPLFYSQVVRCAHLTEMLTASLLPTQPNSETFYVSDPAMLISLFERRASEDHGQENHSAHLETLSFTNRSRWRFLHWLRTQPQKIISKSDGCSFPFSQLDAYVMRTMDESTASRYRRTVIKVLASDHIAFGQPAIIDTLNTIVRIVLCWLSVQSLGEALNSSTGIMLSQESPYSSAALSNTFRFSLGFCGLHLWWALSLVF